MRTGSRRSRWPTLVGWLSIAVTTPIGVATIPMLFLLYPDGALPSRRWRALVVAIVALYPGSRSAGSPSGRRRKGSTRPRGRPAARSSTRSTPIGTILFIRCAIGALASLWVRLRRARRTSAGRSAGCSSLLATMLGAVALRSPAARSSWPWRLEPWFALVLAVDRGLPRRAVRHPVRVLDRAASLRPLRLRGPDAQAHRRGEPHRRAHGHVPARDRPADPGVHRAGARRRTGRCPRSSSGRAR